MAPTVAPTRDPPIFPPVSLPSARLDPWLPPPPTCVPSSAEMGAGTELFGSRNETTSLDFDDPEPTFLAHVSSIVSVVTTDVS